MLIINNLSVYQIMRITNPYGCLYHKEMWIYIVDSILSCKGQKQHAELF